MAGRKLRDRAGGSTGLTLVVRVVGALLAWGVLWTGVACAPSVETRLEDLLARRLHEPRLSTVTEWAPCEEPPPRLRPVSCAPASPVELDPTSRDRITRGVFRSAGERSSDGYRSGLYLLVAGTGSTVDQAVASLRSAAGHSDDPDLHNDLAVAYYVRAQQRSDPVDLVRALDAIERARTLDAGDPRVLFNRALILDRLHLLSTARRAWAESLERDRSSAWGREAAGRLAALPGDDVPAADPRHVPVEEDPRAVREWLQGSWLGEWAEAAAEDVAAARPLLEEAVVRAAELQRVTGDDLLARSVGVIVAAGERGDRQALVRLIRGHRLHAEGSELMEARSFARAEPALEAARRELTAAGSPFAGWAEFLLLRCTYQRQQYAELEDPGRQILARVEEGGASALRGRTWWVLGSARFGRGDLQAAGAAFRRAEEEFARLGERRNVIHVRAMYADLLDWTGRVEDAWRVRHEVLAGLRSAPHPARRRLTAQSLAYSALDLDLPRAAPVLQGEAVAVARAGGRPLPLANALLKRGGIYQRVGEGERAREDLAEADLAVDRIEDTGPREATLAQLRLEQGRLWRAAAPERAAAALDEALAIHRRRDAWLLATDVQLEAARVQRALGRPQAAQRLLAACVDELDRQRATVSTDYERIVLADRAARAYDETVDLLLQRGRPREALLVAERARARRLREWWGEAPDAGSVTLPDETRLAAADAVLAYTVLPERLAAWLLTNDGMDFRTVPVPATELRRLVRDARAAIQTDRADADALLSELHALLVAPFAAELAGRTDLRVVPDDELFLLPFHALRDGDTGRYLLDDHRLRVSPTLATSQREGGSPQRPAPRSVLLATDPAFDRTAHPSLPRLPGAAREGLAVAAEYAEARILDGDEATAETLLRELGRYDAVHVAAHALPHPKDPFRSRLVMAPSPRRAGGELEAREILRLQGRIPDLVVLAACGTVGSEVSRSEGALGMAWSFLAAGAPVVVATLWNLDDAASSELFTRFHRQVAAAVAAPEALRRAQLSMAKRGAPLREWASTIVFSKDI